MFSSYSVSISPRRGLTCTTISLGFSAHAKHTSTQVIEKKRSIIFLLMLETRDGMFQQAITFDRYFACLKTMNSLTGIRLNQLAIPSEMHFLSKGLRALLFFHPFLLIYHKRRGIKNILILLH